ncbi:hypothetical protein NECAME_12533 [Necator americanus]|uniref:Uncharacterized protein n=1 Tax=Necator americanus TaxID=51031 RepID=W2SZI8_NECAM|nr:hypothetical protein NECAME_12533 [Necator americanus]ETN75048.1 hypothetical protein NECAME_12533 [Necator americanus]
MEQSRAQREIAELKAGFKHEMHFNNINENCQTEILTWGVDSNVQKIRVMVTLGEGKCRVVYFQADPMGLRYVMIEN